MGKDKVVENFNTLKSHQRNNLFSVYNGGIAMMMLMKVNNSNPFYGY
jgi:hypothetical protein